MNKLFNLILSTIIHCFNIHANDLKISLTLYVNFLNMDDKCLKIHVKFLLHLLLIIIQVWCLKIPENPQLVSENPRYISENPFLVSENPRFISENPRLLSEKSLYISDNPRIYETWILEFSVDS